jgi:hypothetical protein
MKTCEHCGGLIATEDGERISGTLCRCGFAAETGSTFWWGGDDYQKLADLGEGWALIAHPNGPAISNGDAISVIDIYEGESLALRSIKLRAQEAFRKWAWPRLKPWLTFPDYGRSNSSSETRRGK